MSLEKSYTPSLAAQPLIQWSLGKVLVAKGVTHLLSTFLEHIRLSPTDCADPTADSVCKNPHDRKYINLLTGILPCSNDPAPKRSALASSNKDPEKVPESKDSLIHISLAFARARGRMRMQYNCTNADLMLDDALYSKTWRGFR